MEDIQEVLEDEVQGVYRSRLRDSAVFREKFNSIGDPGSTSRRDKNSKVPVVLQSRSNVESIITSVGPASALTAAAVDYHFASCWG